MNLRAQNDTAGAAPEPLEVTAGRGTPERTAELLSSTAAGTPARPRSGLRPLASLLPYIGRYRGRALAAFGALVLAAVTTLVVPIAARRMIDFGFTERGLNLINSYFLVMIGIAGVLAFASASRYYLVTTLGERIVADLRSDVFAHLTSLSADRKSVV